ncbi:MAG: hypothetical protein GY936_14325 [Ignavibacteriae bacterium]|nr:hypothetical protein [Ignavibacteriota bacterium]
MKFYLTRDKDKALVLWKTKTRKDVKVLNAWVHVKSTRDNDDYIVMPKRMFPEVKWTDKQPTEVDIKIKD